MFYNTLLFKREDETFRVKIAQMFEQKKYAKSNIDSLIYISTRNILL